MAANGHERDKARPLYQIVIDDIMSRINSGAFSFEKPICTESKLMEEYSISRITARRAMTELENRGVLYRKRGVGSFVSRDIYHLQQQKANSSKIIAFLFPFDLSHSGLNAAFQAASAVLMQHGYAASIYITDNETNTRGRAFLSQLIHSDIAGVAYYPKSSDIHLNLLNHLVFSGRPVVIMDIPDRCRYISSVSSDNYGGSRQLTEHLLALGHQRIAYLTGVELDARATISDRFAGYVLAQADAGIPVRDAYVITTLTEAYRRSAGDDGLPTQFHSVVKSLAARGVTAFVCEHDQIAFEAALACRELNIRVPEQISICGFDNSEWARMLPEPITTMEQDMEQVGIHVARQLLAGMGAPLMESRQIVIPTKFISGGTTGPAPAASDGEESQV